MNAAVGVSHLSAVCRNAQTPHTEEIDLNCMEIDFFHPNKQKILALETKWHAMIQLIHCFVCFWCLFRSEFDQRFGVTTTFLATHSGLIRWLDFQKPNNNYVAESQSEYAFHSTTTYKIEQCFFQTFSYIESRLHFRFCFFFLQRKAEHKPCSFRRRSVVQTSCRAALRWADELCLFGAISKRWAI